MEVTIQMNENEMVYCTFGAKNDLKKLYDVCQAISLADGYIDFKKLPEPIRLLVSQHSDKALEPKIDGVERAIGVRQWILFLEGFKIEMDSLDDDE